MTGAGAVRTAGAGGSSPAGVTGARCGVVLAAWLAGPAVVMVTVSPAVLTVSRKVFWGQGAQIPLAATVLPSEVACAIELRYQLAAADLGQPVPGLPGTEVAQARGSNRGRQSPGGAAECRLDLAQAGRPVPVVFRRHPASVPW